MDWGDKIAIVYTAFAAGMVGMLIYSTTFTHELVTEDYYPTEVHYQEHIDAKQNLFNAAFTIDTRADAGPVLVTINGLPGNSGVQAHVNLFKPDNQSFDQSMDLVLTEGNRMVIEPKMRRGRYRVEVSLKIDGKPYLSERQVTL